MTNKQLNTGLLTIILVTNLVFGYFIFFKNSQVVYVDSHALLESYEGMKTARQEFQQKATQWQANIDTLKAELDQTIRAHEAEKQSMSKKELALSQELIQTKQKQFLDYQRAIQQQSQQEDAKMTEAVLVEINAFVEAYGKKKGYQIIFGATNMGNIVYAQDALNVTNELQAALNANYLGS